MAIILRRLKMKPKTARRFLARNWAKIARHNLGIGKMVPSTRRRVVIATRVLLREEGKGE